MHFHSKNGSVKLSIKNNNGIIMWKCKCVNRLISRMGMRWCIDGPWMGCLGVPTQGHWIFKMKMALQTVLFPTFHSVLRFFYFLFWSECWRCSACFLVLFSECCFHRPTATKKLVVAFVSKIWELDPLKKLQSGKLYYHNITFIWTKPTR